MQVLTADRALVGADLRLVEDAAVIIDDGEITWVGPRGEAPGHRGRDDGDARHLGDVTLLPGRSMRTRTWPSMADRNRSGT